MRQLRPETTIVMDRQPFSQIEFAPIEILLSSSCQTDRNRKSNRNELLSDRTGASRVSWKCDSWLFSYKRRKMKIIVHSDATRTGKLFMARRNHANFLWSEWQRCFRLGNHTKIILLSRNGRDFQCAIHNTWRLWINYRIFTRKRVWRKSAVAYFGSNYETIINLHQSYFTSNQLYISARIINHEFQ